MLIHSGGQITAQDRPMTDWRNSVLTGMADNADPKADQPLSDKAQDAATASSAAS